MSFLYLEVQVLDSLFAEFKLLYLSSNGEWEAVCKKYVLWNLEVGNLILAKCAQFLGCGALRLVL